MTDTGAMSQVASNTSDRPVHLSPPPPFLFVIGCRRSGTTLLGTIFDSHSRMAMAHEARFVASCGHHLQRYQAGGRFDVSRLVSDLSGEPGLRRLGLDPAELHELLAVPPVGNYSDAVRRIFATYASRRDKARYGDKMPGYVLHVALLARLFPEARFIHIIRDGRDVALSLTDLWFARQGVGEAALFWRRRVRAGRTAGRRLDPSRYREVRYEDLIADPQSVVADLCAFADLAFEPGMLEFFERGDEVVARTGKPQLHQGLLLPPTSGLRDWSSQMGEDDLVMFESLAGDLLSELGYHRARPNGSPGVRMRAARARAGWGWRRIRSRLPGGSGPPETEGA